MSEILRPPAPAPPTAPRPLPVAGQVAPSFPLVASHLGAGFGWALGGAAGLAWLAPVLARGQFLDPRVLALTHLFTLGWLSTSITGVLYQIFPAMLGIGERSRRVAWLALGLHTTGTALLVTGLLAGTRSLQSLGWSVLFTAVFLTAWNLLPQRRRAPRNRQLGIYISYGHMGFGFAMLVAGARIGDAFGWWTTPRLGLIAAHFQLAIAGFVTMTAFGMGSRMLPMFFGAQARLPTTVDRWLPRALGTGTVTIALGLILSAPVLSWAGIGITVAAAAAFLRHAWEWFAGRARRALDAATTLLTIALVALTTAVPLGVVAAARGARGPGWLTTYAVTLIAGWAGALVLGVSYRVLPTLTWHHRFAARMGRPGTPTLPQTLSPRLGLTAAGAYGAGLAALLPSLLLAHTGGARLGAWLMLAGIVATCAHHLRMFTLTPRGQAAPGGIA
ncbi:MAG: hypothetical protein JNM53_07905 [Gemmatimonadetes bacterium]|nr:hypothetical protein [Gemmatimonadota bacterium]